MLAGFLLAHAVWSVSDLPEGELLVPLAVVEVNGERSLQRFEAETQEEAIAAGKAAMQSATTTAEGWALARGGCLDRDGRTIDVLSVDFWAKGMTKPAIILQEYQPPARSDRFRLLGDPVLEIGGVAQSQVAAKTVLHQVQTGI